MIENHWICILLKLRQCEAKKWSILTVTSWGHWPTSSYSSWPPSAFMWPSTWSWFHQQIKWAAFSTVCVRDHGHQKTRTQAGKHECAPANDAIICARALISCSDLKFLSEFKPFSDKAEAKNLRFDFFLFMKAIILGTHGRFTLLFTVNTRDDLEEYRLD